jgi:TolB-like protein
LNLLAKIDGLKVIGRTSSFAFKGKNEDLRDIGKALGVTTVLEGSVRKSGDRVRVTAQLIDVFDGSHLWSDTYDRTLTDIFAVQDDVAAKALAIDPSPFFSQALLVESDTGRSWSSAIEILD